MFERDDHGGEIIKLSFYGIFKMIVNANNPSVTANAAPPPFAGGRHEFGGI